MDAPNLESEIEHARTVLDACKKEYRTAESRLVQAQETYDKLMKRYARERLGDPRDHRKVGG